MGATLAARERHAVSRTARTQRLIMDVALNILTTLLALGFMFPFLWTVSSALKTGIEVIAYPPRIFPKVIQWGNFAEAWTAIQFGVFFKNSAIVTALDMIGTVASSVLVAYGFSRFRFRGSQVLFLLCLSGMMMPVYVTIIPLFMLFRAVGWVDTLKPLIVPSYFGSAFAIFLMRQFFMSIPFELDESGLLDGASRMTILLRILLPNCKPALAALAIFTFQGTWSNFLGPLIFLDSVKNYTLPLGLWFLRTYTDDPGKPRDHLIMAGSLIATIPVLIVFASAQSYFIEGIVMSGIKG